MKRNKLLFAVLFITAVAASPARLFAWNALGHKTVAEIAWRQLDPPTRQNIVELLRRHPRFDRDFVSKMDDKALTGEKAIEDEWIFQHAATWPDIIRKQKELDRPNWHYIDIPLFLDPSDKNALEGRLTVNISTQYPTKTSPDKYNVVQALAYSCDTLKGKAGPQAKAVACCWILHLVGDIHQPLHCTALFSVDYFPNGDKGGNEVPLVRGKNLHSMWDGLLGRQYYLRDVKKAADELSDKGQFGETWETAGHEANPVEWANESHSLCESVVYNDVILNAVRESQSNAKLDPIDLPTAYYKTAGDVARKRVLTAGLRLAVLLKSVATLDNARRPSK